MDATRPGLPRRSRAKAPLLSIDPSGFRPSLISIEGADGFSLRRRMLAKATGRIRQPASTAFGRPTH